MIVLKAVRIAEPEPVSLRSLLGVHFRVSEELLGAGYFMISDSCDFTL
jgi:hypothetical protein